MNKSVSTNFGLLLKSLRTEKGISQQKLAESAGVERNYIYYLGKDTSEPTLGVLMGLASGLGLSFAGFAALIEKASRSANNTQHKLNLFATICIPLSILVMSYPLELAIFYAALLT